MAHPAATPKATPAPASGVMTSSDINVKIAWLYHVEGMTQEAIAALLKVSRIRVMRSLAASAQQNLVVTTINAAAADQISLERQLERRWGLDGAIVVPTPTHSRDLERTIGHAVAGYLNTQMRDGMTLAVGGGATLHSSLDFLHRRALRDATIVSLVGALPRSQWINPSIVTARIARRLGIDSYQITAPVVVDSADLCQRLWDQPMLAEVRERARQADIALLTVGEIAPSATVFSYGIVPESIAATLRAQGAVANILCYFIDAKGKLVDHEVNGRIMALPLIELAAIPRVVLAAGGQHKVAAIEAALRAVKSEVLITDMDTARALLARADSPDYT
jgi:DNA-binding transcriptional regulator LsrR (DeoR family)